MNASILLIAGLGTTETLIMLLGVIAIIYGIYRIIYHKAHYDITKSKDESSKNLFCSKCGAKNDVANQYCSKCGNKLIQ